MSTWLLGNTTVRSPFRLIDGLKVFALTNGDIRGSREKELIFCKALVDGGIISSNFEAEDIASFSDTTYSVGRKWRSALSKLGFLYPTIASNLGFPQSEIGPVDTITPNGWRLEAST